MNGLLDVFLGLQWGDEGKGKEIDEALEGYDSVCRFQGADNAGHTYKVNGCTIIGHLMPSGSLHPSVNLIIGNGVVLNPVSLLKEKADLESKGIEVRDRLFISERAKLVTYLHPFLDAADEFRMGNGSIGSTVRGVGPAYSDFKARRILMVGDICNSNFGDMLDELLTYQKSQLEMYHRRWKYIIPHLEILKKEKEWYMAVNELRKLTICDVSELLRNKMNAGKRILAEGAQGAMLDCDFGDYPFVTSSNTLPANVCLGLGVPHQAIGNVYGVIKAYTTKVGGGVFPSRMKDTEVERLYQEAGNEFGATTGRRRMCGWLDLVSLKRAIYLSGTTGLFINKADICPVDKIKVVTGYVDKKGKLIDDFPLHLEEIHDVTTIEFDGWGDLAYGIHVKEKLPKNLISYIDFIQSEVYGAGVKIMNIGTGPERGQNVPW